MKLDISLMLDYHSKGLLSKNVHPKFPLLIWNYTPKTQYDKLWDEITLMSRGLITDLEGNILARSFSKFFNIEEESFIPNEPFEVCEKLDGSLIIVFWYNHNLIVSSRGSFCSDHAYEAQSILDECDISCLEKDRCYSFELIVPWNRIVCDYGTSRKLVLLAKFDNQGNEYNISGYHSYFDLPRQFSISNLNGIKETIPKNEEGYVLKFTSGKRVKIKGEEYVKLHRLVSNVSEKSILEMVATGQGHTLDFTFALLPDELRDWALGTRSKIEKRFEEIREQCESSLRFFPSRKEAAAYFLQQDYPHILFAMLDNQGYDDMIWKIIRTEVENEL
jgi:RNA ligase